MCLCVCLYTHSQIGAVIAVGFLVLFFFTHFSFPLSSSLSFLSFYKFSFHFSALYRTCVITSSTTPIIHFFWKKKIHIKTFVLYGVSVALMYYLIVIQKHNPIPFFLIYWIIFVSIERFARMISNELCFIIFFRNFNPFAIEEDSNWFGFLFVFLFAVQSFDPFFGWFFSIYPSIFCVVEWKKKFFLGWNSMEFVLRWAYINLYTNFLTMMAAVAMFSAYPIKLAVGNSACHHHRHSQVTHCILWWNNKRSCLCIESFHLSIFFSVFPPSILYIILMT